MPQDLTADKSTLVQVMAWCRQAITWANVDPIPCHLIALLGHNELIRMPPILPKLDGTNIGILGSDRPALHINELVQERRNSSALAMEFLSCTNQSTW